MTKKGYFGNENNLSSPIVKGYYSQNGVAKKIIFGYKGVRETYTPVEYIESSGTQYIDTGILGNGEFDANFKIMKTAQLSNTIFAGTRSSTQHLNFYQDSTDGTTLAYYNSFWTAGSSQPLNTELECKVSFKNGLQTMSINNVAQTGNTLTGTEQTGLNVYLFKRNYYTSGDTVLPFIGRLYYFQLYNNGTLVRDYIPVKTSGNEYGLYDRVGGKFYPNKGTGAFTGGEETDVPFTAEVAKRIYRDFLEAKELPISANGNKFIKLDNHLFYGNSYNVYELNLATQLSTQIQSSSSSPRASGLQNVWDVGDGYFIVYVSNGEYSQSDGFCKVYNSNTGTVTQTTATFNNVVNAGEKNGLFFLYGTERAGSSSYSDHGLIKYYDKTDHQIHDSIRQLYAFKTAKVIINSQGVYAYCGDSGFLPKYFDFTTKTWVDCTVNGASATGKTNWAYNSNDTLFFSRSDNKKLLKLDTTGTNLVSYEISGTAINTSYSYWNVLGDEYFIDNSNKLYKFVGSEVVYVNTLNSSLTGFFSNGNYIRYGNEIISYTNSTHWSWSFDGTTVKGLITSGKQVNGKPLVFDGKVYFPSDASGVVRYYDGTNVVDTTIRASKLITDGTYVFGDSTGYSWRKVSLIDFANSTITDLLTLDSYGDCSFTWRDVGSQRYYLAIPNQNAGMGYAKAYTFNGTTMTEAIKTGFEIYDNYFLNTSDKKIYSLEKLNVFATLQASYSGMYTTNGFKVAVGSVSSQYKICYMEG